MPRRSRWVLVAGAAYVLAIAVVGLWPTHVDRQLNISTRDGYGLVEFAANVLWFAPLGLLLRALRPRWPWLSVVVTGAVVSAAIEILQAVTRPGRTASIQDVIANTLGAALGCLVYAGWRRWRPRAGR